MPTDVIMPALGMAQETGKVLRWLKSEGDVVEQGAPIMEIETDKVTVEIEAPASGTLTGLRVPEGAEVPVGGRSPRRRRGVSPRSVASTWRRSPVPVRAGRCWRRTSSPRARAATART